MITWDIDLAAKAWSVATAAHKGQKYAGPKEGEQFEYLTHIGQVLMEVMQGLQHHPEADTNLAINCAILHDTVEDSPVSITDIKTQFGDSVANGVAALTKNESLGDKKSQMLDSLERICSQPKEVWMVKMADRIANLSPPPHYWNSKKIEAYRKEAELIYENLHTASPCLANRLQEKIETYRSYSS